LLGVDLDGTFGLVKEFLGLVVVIILSGIRPADDHDDIILGVLVEVFVSNGGFQLIPMLFDPIQEVKRGR
jgi:hypothetical protein